MSAQTNQNEPVSSPRTADAEQQIKPWYMPTSKTIFPIKKSEYRPKTMQQSQVSSTHQEPLPSNLSTEWPTEQNQDVYTANQVEEENLDVEDVFSKKERVPSKVDHPPFRTRGSLEVQISEIEDPEMRRLTAIAYLS